MSVDLSQPMIFAALARGRINFTSSSSIARSIFLRAGVHSNVWRPDGLMPRRVISV